MSIKEIIQTWSTRKRVIGVHDETFENYKNKYSHTKTLKTKEKMKNYFGYNTHSCI